MVTVMGSEGSERSESSQNGRGHRGSRTEEMTWFGKMSRRLDMEHAQCFRLDLTMCNGKKTGQKVTRSEAMGPAVAGMLVC